MESLENILEQQDVRRLRELLEERDDAVLALLDRDARVLWGSVAGSRTLFGRTPEQYVGTTAYDYLHPGDAPGFAAVFAEVTRANENRELTCRVRDGAGGWLGIRSVLWPVTASDGQQAVVVVSVAVDRSVPRPAGADGEPGPSS